MDKSARIKHETKDAKDEQAGDENCASQVVMRKPRSVYEPTKADSVDSSHGNDDDYKKKKHVKWSESTEMRERQKVYRRSQLDIPLDYQHLAIEEEREKEGVHLWRNHLKDHCEDDDDEISKFVYSHDHKSYSSHNTATGRVSKARHVEEYSLAKREYMSSMVGVVGSGVGTTSTSNSSRPAVSGGVEAIAAAASVAESGGRRVGDGSLPDYDTDENDPDVDEDMERNIQIIKEETTMFTLYPAYSAAISVYEEWLSNPEDTKQLTEDQKAAMISQLDLYKRLVSIYKEWTQQTSTDFPRESKFGDVTSILQEASNLGQPPSCVSKVIREVLADEENIQKQVDAYNYQVQEMIAALDIKSKV